MTRRPLLALLSTLGLAARAAEHAPLEPKPGGTAVSPAPAPAPAMNTATADVPSTADAAAPATPGEAAGRIRLSDAEWRQRLPAPAYEVLRHEGTERAGTSPLNAEHRQGIFRCAGCGAPLFSSATKFESGTGWPSFFSPLPGAVATRTDYKMIIPRTEYHCVRCDGHQGHVFNDGPRPTGKRYCNNGVALTFEPDPSA